eukprot:2379219-Rhodomonas_salina.1
MRVECPKLDEAPEELKASDAELVPPARVRSSLDDTEVPEPVESLVAAVLIRVGVERRCLEALRDREVVNVRSQFRPHFLVVTRLQLPRAQGIRTR